jgi:quaternary ammonium compound-resistance protein SugE
MAWLILFLAGLCEVAWAIGLKYSEGYTRLGASVFTTVFMVLSVVLLGLALKSLPVGTAYAVWTGIGAVGVAICGVALFGESLDPVRVGSIALIVVGALGLKLGAS